MTIEQEILRLLQEGLPYSAIGQQLGVSSKTISRVKKEHFPAETSPMEVNGKGLDGTPESDPVPDMDNPQTGKQPGTKQEFRDHYLESAAEASREKESRSLQEIELEKYKARLQYDLEIARMDNEREKEERMHSFRERELALAEEKVRLERERIISEKRQKEEEARQRQEEIDNAKYLAEVKAEEERLETIRQATELQQRQKEDKMNRLKHHFKQVVARCEEGEWSLPEVKDYLNQVDGLLKRIDEMSSGENTPQQLIAEVRTLYRIRNWWEKELQDWEAGEVYELTFDEKFRKALDISGNQH